MARLILEDGREFFGKSLGTRRDNFGEIVFNTSMTGYQEILTDPSYADQIINFTYPEIGNYGASDYDSEGQGKIFAAGIVLKNYSNLYSNYRAKRSFEEFLEANLIPGLAEIDTRSLTLHLRSRGVMSGMIVQDDRIDTKDLLQILQNKKITADLASKVSCKEAYTAKLSIGAREFSESKPSAKPYSIIAFDFGIKTSILDQLILHGANIEVVPANTSLDYVLAAKPDGIFLSNGPGDPAAVDYAIKTVAGLVDKFSGPIFGICLGHQILGLALGALTYKLKFGHRGANQPIKNLQTGKIEIASHNHGFAIDANSLNKDIEISHLNLNDNTIAGIRLKNRPNVFSVQYHPEASPGPHDSHYLFRDFLGFCSN